MSVVHSGVSFNHSCLKVPIDPQNQRPSPNYERSSAPSIIVKNERNNEFHGRCAEERGEPLASPTSSLGNNFKSVESYLQFYENIPDYSDLHHLSDEEFYSRLKSLKLAQKRFCESEVGLNVETERNYELPSSYSSVSSRDKYDARSNRRKNKVKTRNTIREAEPFQSSNPSSLYSPEGKDSTGLQHSTNEANYRDHTKTASDNEKFEAYKSIVSQNLKARNPSRTEADVFQPSNSSSLYSPSTKNVTNVTSSEHTSMAYGRHRKVGSPSKCNLFKSTTGRRLTEPSAKVKPPPKINIVSDAENISDMGYDEKITAEQNSDKNEANDKHHACYSNNHESSMMNIWDKASVNEFMCKQDELDNGNLSDDGFDLYGRRSKSLPSSPGCKSKLCECETPQIFQRIFEIDKEDQNVDPMQFHIHGVRSSFCSKEDMLHGKKKKIRTRPVPLLSRIPLFDKIMAEQEARRRVIHHRYSKELRALVQPFSFTKREEEERQRIRSSCSNPDLSSSSRPHTPFKAKPVPRHLFSNYAYERMREDEFYRALKKRIRAEELLKSSSLPPSMAARERKYRSKSLDFLDYKNKKTRKKGKSLAYKQANDALRREIERDESTKNSCSGKRRSRSAWLSFSRRRNSCTDSSTETSPYESISEPEHCKKIRPHSALSINRNNLASVLRIQTVRKRMEQEMTDNLQENRLKEEARFKARLVRMTPAWRALNYSTEEDLAMRVAARREEERLRRHHHKKLMGSIYGRVHQMPPLFQRQLSPSRNKQYVGGKKKPLDEKELSKSSIVYKDDYYDNEEGNGNVESKEREGEREENEKKQNLRNNCRSHESSSSTPTGEKSEGTKLDESDSDTFQEEEIEDYVAQGNHDEN